MPKTSCKDCVFAKYDDVTQIGCHCGQLEVFRKNEIEVTECYDNEKEFFTLDTFCLFHKTKEWLQTNGIEKADIKMVAEKMLADSTLKYTALIWANPNDIEGVAFSVDSLLANSIKPKKVIIMLQRPSTAQEVDQMCLMLELKSTPWKVQNPTEELSIENNIDLATHNLEVPSYFVLDAGQPALFKDIAKINGLLNLGNFVFSIIEYGGNKKLVNYKIHKLLNGNHFDKSLKDKILESEVKNEWPQTIFQFSSLEEIEH